MTSCHHRDMRRHHMHGYVKRRKVRCVKRAHLRPVAEHPRPHVEEARMPPGRIEMGLEELARLHADVATEIKIDELARAVVVRNAADDLWRPPRVAAIDGRADRRVRERRGLYRNARSTSDSRRPSCRGADAAPLHQGTRRQPETCTWPFRTIGTGRRGAWLRYHAE